MIYPFNVPIYLKYTYNFCYISATDTEHKETLNLLVEKMKFIMYKSVFNTSLYSV